MARFLPLWKEQISPEIKAGKRLLITAHGNSLRALIQHVEKLTPEQIMEVNVPTGIPLLYEFSLDPTGPAGADLKVLGKRYLGDPAVVTAAIEKVAAQGKKK